MSEELNQEIIDESEEEESNIPDRRAKDHLPVKSTWQVIALGVFYSLLGVALTWLMVYLFTGSDGPLSWITWVSAIFIVLGTFSAYYTAWDELRHIKHALLLDKQGVLVKARIIDRWTDNYADGGILTRKKVSHILYTYQDNQHYGKHSITKGLYKSIRSSGWVEILYLPENPEIFRMNFQAKP